MPPATAPRILLIGYGSTLRGDDGVGACVAAELALDPPPCLRVIERHLLTPELAGEVAECDLVIFADAAVDLAGESVEVRAVPPDTTQDLRGHDCAPGALMAMVEAIYRRTPTAWLVALPAKRFEIGEQISPVALRGVHEAVEIIRQITAKACADWRPAQPPGRPS